MTTTPLTPASVLSRKSAVRFRVVAGEGLALNQDDGLVLGLSSVASLVFERIDGAASIEDIARSLEPTFDVAPGRLHADVLAFCEELRNRGLVDAAS